MSNPLRKYAEQQPCFLRLWPFCTHDKAQTVLAHIRRGNTAGGGQKPDDVNGVPACHACHDVYDGRQQQDQYNRDALDAEMLRAHCQWIAFLRKREVLIVCL